MLGYVSALVRFADEPTDNVRGPYGIQVPTPSASIIEVSLMPRMMAAGAGNTLLRDTVFAALMIPKNGLVHLAPQGAVGQAVRSPPRSHC